MLWNLHCSYSVQFVTERRISTSAITGQFDETYKSSQNVIKLLLACSPVLKREQVIYSFHLHFHPSYPTSKRKKMILNRNKLNNIVTKFPRGFYGINFICGRRTSCFYRDGQTGKLKPRYSIAWISLFWATVFNAYIRSGINWLHMFVGYKMDSVKTTRGDFLVEDS